MDDEFIFLEAFPSKTLQRKTIGDRILKKIVDFVETFKYKINGA